MAHKTSLHYEVMRKHLRELSIQLDNPSIDYYEMRDLLDAIDALKADRDFIRYLIDRRHLIPVSDKLPAYGERVITWNGSSFYTNDYREHCAWNDGNPGWGVAEYNKPNTYWMPLCN